MTQPSSHSSSPAVTRRLLACLVVGGIAAAAAAVAFDEPPRGAVVARAPIGVPAGGDAALVPGHARRVKWRDPWRQSSSDPSLPSAHEALAGIAVPSDAPAPTF